MARIINVLYEARKTDKAFHIKFASHVNFVYYNMQASDDENNDRNNNNDDNSRNIDKDEDDNDDNIVFDPCFPLFVKVYQYELCSSIDPLLHILVCSELRDSC